ncbi:CHRD domain-containing protein [Hymenobacter sp. DH14]|uniref:CHRD domain-containing protein n=1 Tax=Hymenobacter cyanobacteriorum TaxID=2926463 RepID=A0A9X1VE73_9BACT|nr:CHRD domain-containing protein [Hymenobacter cyanobacteriorum]MCI1186900.1 CHRD domain-containing protein [Hymenobacter cyanobacteriorum]
MNKSYAFLALLSFTTVLGSCSKDDSTPTATATVTNLTATVNGAQQVPANNSAATGTFTGTYDSNNKQLAYTVTFQGMTATSAHIHTGAPGVSGAVAIPFASVTSPITGTVTLTADQATQLLNNGMYVNIHSNTYANGEIRGDIKKK